jgi:hypothetical protein
MRSFWTFVGIRTAFWVGTAATLIWVPLHGTAIPADRAYTSLGDLLFGTFEHWDAQWFLHVAQDGYNPTSAAFFPLYPLLLHVLHWPFQSWLVAGTLLSLAAGGVAAWALAQIARPLLGVDGSRDAVLYLALMPTAFVFTALYSDSLFLALSTLAFLAAQRGKGWAAGVAGGLAVATRLVGLALLPALAVLLWQRRRNPVDLVPLVLLPVALLAFSAWLGHDPHVNDWLAWKHAQGTTEWQRQTGRLGPLTGLWWAIQAGGHGGLEILRHLPRGLGAPVGYSHADTIAFWNATHLVLLAIGIWLTWVAWKRLGPAFGLYSAATLVVILWAPSKGFPLVSLPRLLMDDFPLVLALVVVTRSRGRDAMLIALAALTAVAGVAFAHGVWIA